MRLRSEPCGTFPAMNFSSATRHGRLPISPSGSPTTTPADHWCILRERRGPGSSEGATEIFIFTPDRPRLFATTVATLSQLGLSVFEANIHTSANGLCLNTFIVLDQQGDAPGFPSEGSRGS